MNIFNDVNMGFLMNDSNTNTLERQIYVGVNIQYTQVSNSVRLLDTAHSSLVYDIRKSRTQQMIAPSGCISASTRTLWGDSDSQLRSMQTLMFANSRFLGKTVIRYLT